MRAPLWALACCMPIIQARRLYGIFPGAGAASEALEWRGEWRRCDACAPMASGRRRAETPPPSMRESTRERPHIPRRRRLPPGLLGPRAPRVQRDLQGGIQAVVQDGRPDPHGQLRRRPRRAQGLRRARGGLPRSSPAAGLHGPGRHTGQNRGGRCRLERRRRRRRGARGRGHRHVRLLVGPKCDRALRLRREPSHEQRHLEELLLDLHARRGDRGAARGRRDVPPLRPGRRAPRAEALRQRPAGVRHPGRRAARVALEELRGEDHEDDRGPGQVRPGPGLRADEEGADPRPVHHDDPGGQRPDAPGRAKGHRRDAQLGGRGQADDRRL
mmetsp:Transcript_3854/g.8982  ORF Transcript_3854/g.8982 Transcript_3854/m.8982 type:complete len:329 (+) Transcript_3854:112-1098(+)